MKATLAQGTKLEGVPSGAELMISHKAQDTLSIFYEDNEKKLRRILLGHPEIVFLAGNSLHITGFLKTKEQELFSRVRFIVDVG